MTYSSGIMNAQDTRLAEPTPSGISEAANIIKNGGIVAFPTETVYGLGADATNVNAVKRIYEAKGRPAANPLIVHIADKDDTRRLFRERDERVDTLIEAFWPGALTIIHYKSDAIPSIVSGGLDTVALRMPSHPVALSLISESRRPIAAPSANLSGSPSPTRAIDVLNDMRGRVPLIIDGGDCDLGLESTVVSLCGETATLLRPGLVTFERLAEHVPIRLGDALLSPANHAAKAISPGVLFKHYAPRTRLILLQGTFDEQLARADYLLSRDTTRGISSVALVSDEMAERLAGCVVRMGSRSDLKQISRNLFTRLRELDDLSVIVAYAETYEARGEGLALMNRLLRAASFTFDDGRR